MARNVVLKWTALTLMLVQNAAFVLVMRYSRKQQAGAAAVKYNVSLVVTLQEAFKLVLCVAVLALQAGGSLAAGFAPMTRPRELARIMVPAVCIGYITGHRGVSLRQIEEETKTSRQGALEGAGKLGLEACVDAGP